MWAGSWYFLDSVGPHVRDADIDRLVAPPDYRHRFRGEGWAVTEYGKYGIAAIADLRAVAAEKVAIWGDSFVEGQHVPDPDKMAQQVTSIWQDQEWFPLIGVGIGRGDRTVADYYHLLPRYEAITDFLCHFIVLPSLRDVCPDGLWFASRPSYHFRDRERRQPLPGLRAVLDRHRLEFLWGPLWSLWGKRSNPISGTPIRFRPGPAPPSESMPRDWATLAATETAAWDFLTAAVAGQTRRPVIFVYAPRMPYLEAGEVSSYDPGAASARRFAASCRRARVGFMDLTETFLEYHRETGRFPRGFANSIPGRGHLNRAGHRLVAESICAHVASHLTLWQEEQARDAVHAD